jgi:hypothetical protein
MVVVYAYSDPIRVHVTDTFFSIGSGVALPSGSLAGVWVDEQFSRTGTVAVGMEVRLFSGISPSQHIDVELPVPEDGSLYGAGLEPLGDGRLVLSYVTGSSGFSANFQILGGDGAVLADEAVIHRVTSGSLDVEATDSGGFAALYVANTPAKPSNGDDIWAQFYDSDGLATGTRVRINAFTTGSQDDVGCISLSGDRMVAFWTDRSNARPEPGKALVARLFGEDGAMLSREIVVTTEALGDPNFCKFAELANGRLLAVWQTSPPTRTCP